VYTVERSRQRQKQSTGYNDLSQDQPNEYARFSNPSQPPSPILLHNQMQNAIYLTEASAQQPISVLLISLVAPFAASASEYEPNARIRALPSLLYAYSSRVRGNEYGYDDTKVRTLMKSA
jgi:hypothetical protein